MAEPIVCEVSEVEELRKQLAALTERLAKLETWKPEPDRRAAAAPEASKIEAEPEITEEELLAISAAIAAYLGVRAHIRQIRLISSPAWAQQGRVSIQASHRLHRSAARR